MHDDHRSNLHPADVQDFRDILELELRQVDSGKSFAEGILEDPFDHNLIFWLSIDRHRFPVFLFKASKVIHSHDVIRVGMSDEYGVNALHSHAQELEPHFWAGVDQQIASGPF